MCPEWTLKTMVGVTGFEPATPTSRTEVLDKKITKYLQIVRRL
jgi:hypothetical protein